MKNFKLLSSILSTCLLLCSITPLKTNATSYARLVDNDPINSGYSFSCYNMNYYSGLSGSYNFDARMSPMLNNLYAYAYWYFPPIVNSGTSCSATLGVYLNNANFTEPHALYCIGIDNNNHMEVMGEINQNYAASGWNYLHKTVSAYSTNNYISTGYVFVDSHTSGNVQLGADAVSLNVTF